MNRFFRRMLPTGAMLGFLVGCQASPPQGEAPEAPEETPQAVVEESFETGDTGSLKQQPEELAEPEAEDGSQ